MVEMVNLISQYMEVVNEQAVTIIHIKVVHFGYRANIYSLFIILTLPVTPKIA